METSTEGPAEDHAGEAVPARAPAPRPAPVVEPAPAGSADAAAAGPADAMSAPADAGRAAAGDATTRAPEPEAPVAPPAAGPGATVRTPSGEAGPTARADVPGAGGEVRAAAPPSSLSPSRAGDFMQCPLLYRFRVIDRLPEKPSEAATRGTLVHAVLERLFDAPAAERTAPRAKALVPGQWDRLRESRPELVELFDGDADGERLARWLAEAERLVERWFTLEDPTRLEPAERELFVEAELDSGLRLRGIIDRVDVAPTGEVRIVDYKTGKAPRPEYAEGALFQMKFYALVVWRLKRVVPRRLQLVYLGSGDVLTYDPVPADLERTERKLLALWEAIRLATETGDWRPRPTKLCGWCDHRAHCPEFGGTPPPYPLPLAPVAPPAQGRMGPD
ncbi:RecB family exonuclease [Streptomyces sp. NPDC015220]|uniref:RecB family exonuclease n=1 Tax=Streptomyces sp. NPDC015220 TaxID=3364947 RepID=UPI0036FB723A